MSTPVANSRNARCREVFFGMPQNLIWFDSLQIVTDHGSIERMHAAINY
jgi:hypothetical protein